MKIERMRGWSWRWALLIPAGLCTVAGSCQQRINAPREDGRTTPLLVYAAAGSGGGCAPLAVISHGAGGSENGYRYLAEAMSRDGFTTIVMGHRESGFAALRDDMVTNGVRPGIQALVADPKAESARLMDVSAALRWSETQCHAPFRVLLGHSMGAETVMLEAGARNRIGVTAGAAGQDRFDAYVALSPEGPGIVFPDHAWSGIRKPVLILTGTRDQSLQGGPEARLAPWADLPDSPSHCHWEGVLDGATHMNFAGSGWGHERAEPLITGTIGSFLAGVRTGTCSLPTAGPGMTLKGK